VLGGRIDPVGDAAQTTVGAQDASAAVSVVAAAEQQGLEPDLVRPLVERKGIDRRGGLELDQGEVRAVGMG
jgi:hypothetical protein